MFSLTIAVSADREQLLADLWEAGTVGITEEPETVRAFFEDEGKEAVLAALRHYSPETAIEESYDWVQHYRDQWKPFSVGARWWLAPEWEREAAPEGRVRLPIFPGMACGTGWHPATQLSLTAMESHVGPGQRVLDVGTGSGILVQAAQLLGAACVYGCDIDLTATSIAAKNVAAPFFNGSLRAVRHSSMDVIVANLNAATLKQVASGMKDVLRPDGAAIVSGFREDEADEVAKSFASGPASSLEQDGWACLVFPMTTGEPK